MKIPFRVNISLEAYRSGLNRQKPSSNREYTGTDQFSSLLEDSIESMGSSGNYPYKTEPLDRNQALKLLEIIQTRMNAYLLEALSEPDENNTPSRLNLDWMDICRAARQQELEVSKYQQASMKVQTNPSRAEIENIIGQASKTYGVDSGLIKAVVKAESDFDNSTTSHKGAMGLMQLMPETAKDLGVINSYDPVENVMAGTRYLKGLLDRYDGNVNLALAAYNWGMGNLERHPERLPQETQTYIARVNKFWRETREAKA